MFVCINRCCHSYQGCAGKGGTPKRPRMEGKRGASSKDQNTRDTRKRSGQEKIYGCRQKKGMLTKLRRYQEHAERQRETKGLTHITKWKERTESKKGWVLKQ